LDDRIKQLRRELSGQASGQSKQALADIQAIQDPQAAEAIVAALHSGKRSESGSSLDRDGCPFEQPIRRSMHS